MDVVNDADWNAMVDFYDLTMKYGNADALTTDKQTARNDFFTEKAAMIDVYKRQEFVAFEHFSEYLLSVQSDHCWEILAAMCRWIYLYLAVLSRGELVQVFFAERSTLEALFHFHHPAHKSRGYLDPHPHERSKMCIRDSIPGDERKSAVPFL